MLAASASAATTVTLEAHTGRPGIDVGATNLGSVVDIGQVAGGYTLVASIDMGADSGTATGFKVTLTGTGNYAAMVDWLDAGIGVENYADAYDTPPFGAPRNTSGWETANSQVVILPAGSLPMSGLGNDTLGSISDGAGSGFACYLTMENAVIGEISSAADIALTGVTYPTGTVLPTVVPLVITPEPASALLLLLGVPFLRRRR